MKEPVFSYADSSFPPVKRGLIRLLEAATGQRRLKRIYHQARSHPVQGESFWQAAVRGLSLDVRYNPSALSRIPKSGPVVVVANHPYGVLDGVVLSWLIAKVRSDFLVLTHSLLLRAPEVRPHFLPIDFTGTPEALSTNIESRARARQHLDGGGCVIIFPAGAISTAPDRLGRCRAVDGPWAPFAAQLIQRARATVVPVCFEGQNSRLFQIASHVSPALRLSLIFHEVSHRIGTAVLVAVGDPIPFAALAPNRDRQAFVDDLKARTYGLASGFASLAANPPAVRPGERRRPLLAPLSELKRRSQLVKPALARKLKTRRPGQPRPR